MYITIGLCSNHYIYNDMLNNEIEFDEELKYYRKHPVICSLFITMSGPIILISAIILGILFFIRGRL